MTLEVNQGTIFSLGFKLGSADRLLDEASKTLRSPDKSHFVIFLKLHEAKQDLIHAHSLLLASKFRDDAQMIKNVVTHLDKLLSLPLVGSPKAWSPREPDLDRTVRHMKEAVGCVFKLVSSTLEGRMWENAV